MRNLPRSSAGVALYRQPARVEVRGRTAIVIDDGVSTGATTRGVTRDRARHPAEACSGGPVAPSDSLAELRDEADDVVCLEDHEFFGAIGAYYADFHQISDAEVIETLKRFPVLDRAAKAPANESTAP